MENLEKKAEAKTSKKTIIIYVAIFVSFLAIISGGVYWKILQGRIFIEKAEISAPMIELSAKNSGILEEIFVREGDRIKENQLVARIGNEMVKAQSDGVVMKIKNDIGKNFNPGEPVVSMIGQDEIRVVGHLDEDKGLKDVRIGQRVVFIVDAYGSKEFTGIVDEISETSRDSDVVFSISDKRETKKFDIKIRFNVAEYPELKNGMSAQAWVYKN